LKVKRTKRLNNSPKKQPKYRSGFEKKAAKSLEEAGIKYEYETRTVNYVIPASNHRYVPDFLLTPNGILVEAKGKFDRASRQKMALVIEQNPDLDIRILFMRDNTISKSSKTKYSDWCKKKNIKFHISAIGEIPREWTTTKGK
jgi:Phage endonuclease I